MKGPRATSNHSLACANHNPLKTHSSGLEIFPEQNRGCPHSGSVPALSLLSLLYKGVAEPQCPVCLGECSECDSKDKGKEGKRRRGWERRGSVLGEKLNKSDAESTPYCWSGWEFPCFAGLGCCQLPSSGMAIVKRRMGMLLVLPEGLQKPCLIARIQVHPKLLPSMLPVVGH